MPSCAVFVMLLMVAGAPEFVASAQSTGGELRLYIDEVHASELDTLSGPENEIIEQALVQLRRDGYLLAELDRVETESDTAPTLTKIYIDRGPELLIGDLQVEGVELELQDLLLPELKTTVDAPLRQDQLESDIDQLLLLLEEGGYPFAEVTISELQVESDSSLTLHLEVETGEDYVFGGIEVADEVRSSPNFLARMLGLQPGDPLYSRTPPQMQADLQATGLFRSVGEPVIEVDNNKAILHLPLEEERLGAFDLAMGYQPNALGGGSIVGNGHIYLRNPFGGGRELSLRLDQRPGSVSHIHASASEPYILNTPLSIGGSFDGRQQDSTYNQQTFRVDAGYRLGRHLDVYVSAERRQTQPGVAATGQQDDSDVARASRYLFGAGLSYYTTRQQIAPRQGFQVDLHAARGIQERRTQNSAGSSTIQNFPQEQISARLRSYMSPASRHVFVLGVEGEALISDIYDSADLLRLGGARSLRGYDEEQFAGWMAGRLVGEYRHMFGLRSYAFIFSDVGYLEETEIGAGAGQSRWLPGFGSGAQVDTALGLLTIAYAMNNNDTLLDGRLHFQLSIGL